jgi:hypothetical protein
VQDSLKKGMVKAPQKPGCKGLGRALSRHFEGIDDATDGIY